MVTTPKKPIAKKTNLQALARHVGLSTTTVSVVISGAPAAQGIPAVTKERIFKAAAELDYRPNYLARSLRGSRSMSVGILAAESSEGYFTLVMNGVEEVFKEANYFYFSASHYGRQELVDEYARLMRERSVDGLLLISTPPPTDIDLPIVGVSGRTLRPGVTNIGIDHHKAALLALRYLKKLGHRKIVFIRGFNFNVDADHRWQAILEVANMLRIRVDPALCIELELNSWSPQTGYDPVKSLLAKTRDFTAIFCFNDIAALGAIRALHDAGIAVPQNVSVVGFDDIVGGSFSIPSLTTVRQPLIAMGRLAAQTLLERIENPDKEYPQEVALEPALVIRESTTAPRIKASQKPRAR
jgi:DNA-binding LacI/PurR family transcriptional regulator